MARPPDQTLQVLARLRAVATQTCDTAPQTPAPAAADRRVGVASRAGQLLAQLRQAPDRLLQSEPILRWRLSSNAARWLAVALIMALAWGAWLALGSKPAQATAPVVVPVAAPSQVAKMLIVDVTGPVLRPGIVRVPDGARVVDVIRAAGGLRKGADAGNVNLARAVSDGEQVAIGADGPATAHGSGSPTLVDLNTAGLAELDALPHVGPVLAQRIIDWRDSHGRFSSVDELREIAGIGASVFADLARRVHV